MCIQFSRNQSHHTQPTSDEVRVRFGPSPTGLFTISLHFSKIFSISIENVHRFSISIPSIGYLHLGGLRVALYNYLFARQNNGKFIVRIEDTDQKRTIADAQRSIFDNFAWAGIQPDESILHGGDYGPYIQSERLDLYQNTVERILNNGRAYRCFCSSERLEMVRRAAMERNESKRYDGHCRHLSSNEIEEKLANGDSYCIRYVHFMEQCYSIFLF